MSEDHPKRASRLVDLGVVYTNRYKHLGALSDLDAAIQCDNQALHLTPENHLNRASRLGNLGIDYNNRYQQTGTLDDLELSIQYHQGALDLTLEGLDRIGRLQSLGLAYGLRYQRVGTLHDLEISIQLNKEALDLTPQGSDRADRLQNLGALYRDLYQRNGFLDDLELSIQLAKEALDLMSEDPNRADRLQNLGVAYHIRYERTIALDDLQISIQYQQEALDLTTVDSDRISRLQNLGAAYDVRWQRTGALNDLEDAIQSSQEALNLTPQNHPNKASRLRNLAIGYSHRYEQTGVLDDLNLSIQLNQEALDLTPRDHLNRANQLQSLAAVYHSRYQRTEAPDDIELSIRLDEEATDLTPKNHLERAVRLNNLGLGYRDRHRRTGALDDFELSIQGFKEALNQETSPPVDRFHAGRNLFDAYAGIENWLLAYETASQTISLIPLLTSRSLERSDIQYRVNEIVGLASDATAAALRAKKPIHKAAQLLEVGRGIIASSLGDMRTQITDLNAKFPDLAGQFNSLRSLLDSPKDSRQDTRRYNTGKQFEKLIQKVRGLPGFDRFLLAPSEDEMRRAAVHGPIIIVNVSVYGCHALILEQKGFRALALPLLEIDDIRNKADGLSSPDAKMLGWLWDAIACPILTYLNFVQTPKHTWPRVWWILTGPLARFPIHAAGNYSEGKCEPDATVMDRVISSYSSSVRAIIDAQRNISAPINSSKEGSIVLIGMEKTPGYSSLQFVQKEIDVLAKLSTSTQLQVKRPLSLQRETLSAMIGCKIFHFAGHGYTNPSDPSKSALVLGDGELTAEKIFDINLHQHKPFLAYLSACGTGQIKHKKLIDEGLHLISAFQLAGFRHVVGTLWEVNDESCVDIARMTYEWIQKQGLSDSSVSEGLHHACRKLRKQWFQENAIRAPRYSTQFSADTASIPEQSHPAQTEVESLRDLEPVGDLPLHWVPYVHFGV